MSSCEFVKDVFYTIGRLWMLIEIYVSYNLYICLSPPSLNVFLFLLVYICQGTDILYN